MKRPKLTKFVFAMFGLSFFMMLVSLSVPAQAYKSIPLGLLSLSVAIADSFLYEEKHANHVGQ